MSVDFKKPGRTYSKDPQISVTSTRIRLNHKAVEAIFDNYDGEPTHVKIGVDQDAGWIVVLPVESAHHAYKLPDDPDSSHGISSDSLREFVIDKVEGLSEEDLNVRYTGYWDDHEGAMLFEFA